MFSIFFILFATVLNFCQAKNKINCSFENTTACKVYRIKEEPNYYLNDSSKTSPLPGSFIGVIEETTTNSLTEFVVRLKWKQRATEIQKYVNGFYIVVNLKNIGVYRRKLTLNKQMIKFNSKYIMFRYNSFDIGEMIYPGDEIYISLFSLPMYQSTDINQSITKPIRAPSCEQGSLHKYCFLSEAPTEQNKSTTKLTSGNAKKISYCGLKISIALLAVTVLLIVLFLVFKRRNMNLSIGRHRKKVGERVMVWVEARPRNLTAFHEFAQEFAVQLNSALKEKNSKVNPVACNLWCPDRNLQDWVAHLLSNKTSFRQLVVMQTRSDEQAEALMHVFPETEISVATFDQYDVIKNDYVANKFYLPDDLKEMWEHFVNLKGLEDSVRKIEKTAEAFSIENGS